MPDPPRTSRPAGRRLTSASARVWQADPASPPGHLRSSRRTLQRIVQAPRRSLCRRSLGSRGEPQTYPELDHRDCRASLRARNPRDDRHSLQTKAVRATVLPEAFFCNRMPNLVIWHSRRDVRASAPSDQDDLGVLLGSRRGSAGGLNRPVESPVCGRFDPPVNRLGRLAFDGQGGSPAGVQKSVCRCGLRQASPAWLWRFCGPTLGSGVRPAAD